MNLETLCQELINTKTLENAYAEERKRIEEEITKIVATKDEGTDKAEAGNYSVTVTSKINRSLDLDAYLAVEQGLPEGLRCVDYKPAINLKKLRALELVDPALPAQFITTKAAKAQVKVEVI